ncbi:UDP-glycosyltransferase 75C1-like [Diospyros lotus]|uniref:UDP-glycosyltransferase 75C1-like n=1 Tax=Diospyros lotus TaxID=55363 RepID=UPI0022559544|nr:UDP-glycosyltransferase 75C1-like [Diospyros lotus]
MNPHILHLTFPAQGSINPSLQFAINLAKMGVKVTVLGSLFAHRCMSEACSSADGLKLRAFSDGYDDGFKPSDGDHERFFSQLETCGSEALAEVIAASAAAGSPVTALVYTMGMSWAVKVADSFRIPSVVLWIQPATVLGIYFYFFHGHGAIRELGNDPSSSVQLPGLPKLSHRDLPTLLDPSSLDSATFISFALQRFKEQIEALDADPNTKILVNTFDRLESEALRAVQGLNLVPIGPLIPSSFLRGRESRGHHPSDTSYLEWLDSKPEASVVYVSFGTVAVVSEKQIEEMATGLLSTHRPFLWAIKTPVSHGEELEEKGMIVPWCSQAEVLSHPSLGCFVSHCGWNSTLESLVAGVPVVGLPQFTDQPTNAKLVEDEFKTGVRARANEDGVFEGAEIKRCVEMVLGRGEKGKELKRNAEKWKALAKEATMEGGSSYLNLRNFFIDGLLQDQVTQ